MKPALLVAFLAVLVWSLTACHSAAPKSQSPDASSRSDEAFRVVASVLRHPRCLNCHTNTEFVRVGDDRMPHRMNVLRGPSNQGVPGMRCSSCHQDENQDEVGVPGAPHWSAAPLSMGWEGLDDHDLAQALVDPARNGGRSLADLVKHMSSDPLVVWGWDPGQGRTPVPTDHETFVKEFEIWIESGAVPPAPGTTTY